MRHVAAVVMTLGLAGMALAQEPAVPGKRDLWEIASTRKTVTWIVIHNLEDGKASGLFHVEVLRRGRTDPAWRFERLAAHMAVTSAALRASALRPMRSGRPYPEHFTQAFAKWQAMREAGAAPACETNVLDCLKSR